MSAMVLMLTNCSKNDSTPSNDSDSYVGYWYNDSTLVNGKNLGQVRHEFDFQARKLIITDLGNSSFHIDFASWTISENKLYVNDYISGDYGGDYTFFTIISPPSNNKMVLEVNLWDGKEIDRFFLRKNK